MDTSDATRLDFIVGELVLLDGRRQSDAVHMAVLTPPRRARPDRRHETLFVFLDLGGGGAGGLSRAMLEHFSQTYWHCSGTVTTALRRSVHEANSHLQEENRLMAIGQRRRGGLVCAVLRDDYLYLVQIGPTKALLVQGEQVTQFATETKQELYSEQSVGLGRGADVSSRSSERLPLGVSSSLDMQFSHSYLSAGDRLLLSGESWSGGMSASMLANVLARDSIEEVMLELERRASMGAFSALVFGCVSRIMWSEQSDVLKQERPTASAPITPIHPDSPCEPMSPTADDSSTGPDRFKQRWRLSNPLSGVSVRTERLGQARKELQRAGRALGDGAQALLTRVLPEPEIAPPSHRRRARRKKENVPMMAGVAVAIPLLVAFIVVTFYLQRSASARREALVKQAHAAVETARLAHDQEARDLWDDALQAAQEALLIAPRDNQLITMWDEARSKLDALNGTLRPDLVLVWDYGAGEGRRLAASRMQVYVLDAAQHQVTQHTLNQAHQGVVSDQLSLVAYRGEVVGDGEVGELRDIVWLEAGGAWVGDALLILTQDNLLLQFSLSWGLSWVPFDTGLAHISAHVLRPYGGNLYLLDREQGQVWRFPSSADGLGPPEGYFAAAAPDLSHVVDMIIDGSVYILMSGPGTEQGQHVYKFFGGEAQPFQIRGLPQSLVRPVAMVSEGDVTDGALYVADAGAQSIIALTKDGEFIYQIKAPVSHAGAANDVALANMEALAIEKDGRTLYVLAGGCLYGMVLPPVP